MHNIEEKQGYKFTEEFGYIPEDWDILSLEDVCVKKGLVRGPFGGALKKDIFCKQGYKVYEQQNAIYKTTEFGSYYVNKEKYISMKRFQINSGDFILSCSGTIGELYEIPYNAPNGIINQALLKITLCNYCINKNYFNIFFSSNILQNKIIDDTQGGAMKNLVGMDKFRKTPILLPPLPEQEKIAEVLCDIDELIDSTQKLIDKKKDLKTATIQKLLAPKPHWLKKTLGELNIKMLKGSGLSKEDLKDNGRYSCIHYGELFTYYKEHINKILHFTDEMTVPSKENDVLMPSSDVTPTGLAKASCINFKDVALGGDILIIRCENIIDGTFLSYIIRKDKKQILQLVSGTTVYHIYPNDMKRFEIFYPNSISEQKNIVSILQDMDAEIEALEKELNKYKDLKTGMMQELLTGKKRLLNNPNKVELFNVKKMSTPANKKVANDEFKDAIIISMLAYKFGSNQYPLGAFRRQKLSYLFKRHNNLPIDEYLKKAMGPYNPQMKYSGGEGIAIRNKYVKEVKQRGLIASSEIAKAKTYFDKYYSKDSLLWLEQNFRYKNNNELEVLATIDYTILDLKAQNKEITLANIKEYINNNAEWKPKLEKPFFTDSAIIKAIQESKNLLNSH